VAGLVTGDPKTSAELLHGMGCVIDKATRSLVFCEHFGHALVRMRGVDV
jgi:hypothetical protein